MLFTPGAAWMSPKAQDRGLIVSGTWFARLGHLPAFLALQKSTIGLLIMVILVDMGERMAERFLPIYLMALGGGAISIGLLGAMDNLLSALYSFPGGYLSDRIGAKRALAIFNLVAMIGFGIVIVVPTWQAVLVGAVFFISWSSISLPATMSLMFRVLPQNKRTMGGEHALPCAPYPHGTWPSSGRSLYRFVGRTRRDSPCLRSGLCNGRGRFGLAATFDRERPHWRHLNAGDLQTCAGEKSA